MAARAGDRTAKVRSRGPGGVAAAAGDRSRSVLPRSQVVEIQRSRLLSAAVRAVEELGYSRATVAHITRRARVSRRTFYELFGNREQCLLAVIDDALDAIGSELTAAELSGLAWRERVRAGLAVILAFFDREPALANVCVVQASRGGPAVLERREEVLARLVAVIDEGRHDAQRGAGCSPLTAEGLVGAAFTIIYTRLLRGRSEPLTGLLGELMGMIVLPYLGPAAARREQVRPVAASVREAGRMAVGGEQAAVDPLVGLSMRMTYRTARVLEGVREDPGASNRQIADHAGIHDQGQVSKLLARLERLGLLTNQGPGHAKGEPNAWRLTSNGELVARSIRLHARGEAA